MNDSGDHRYSSLINFTTLVSWMGLSVSYSHDHQGTRFRNVSKQLYGTPSFKDKVVRPTIFHYTVRLKKFTILISLILKEKEEEGGTVDYFDEGLTLSV